MTALGDRPQIRRTFIGSTSFEQFLADSNAYVDAVSMLADSIRAGEPVAAEILDGFAVTTASNALNVMQNWPYVTIRALSSKHGNDAS